ncbi:hypothetical protein GMOD_00008529 [Pyrenophora seminiperda CCB06]|uniref:Uncharacterized protein n=1 Tax=Pyrenophora seminiperda CCB06 TaxID=1302712 RepID=A0A3M7M8Z2_9PLEO|nr:hypothetical protein GMOD_00008529 [Pyrenophora seminiperda CCB06]
MLPLGAMDAKQEEDLVRIDGWLAKMDIGGSETNVSDDDEIDKETTENSMQPITPPQRPHKVLDVPKEISPTDTTFSGRSIFDKPLPKKAKYDTLDPKFEVLDDVSDTTRDSEVEWEPTPIKECDLKSKAGWTLQNTAVTQSGQASVYSSAILSLSDKSAEFNTRDFLRYADLTSQLTRDPNIPRLVWLTSCLQCILAGLPCSRTHPSCSRCQRSANPDLCLLHRRCFSFEILDPSKSDECCYPILLKVKGEDEAIWQRKAKLSVELKNKWLEEQYKKNWVMPKIESRRGGWKKEYRFQVVPGRDLHPGEGSGRTSHKELVVDLEA